MIEKVFEKQESITISVSFTLLAMFYYKLFSENFQIIKNIY